ncbi:MAG: SRPBCC family protein [Myxococcota bacterium]
MGNRAQNTQQINAAIAPTWAAISDMGAVEHWHPNVARVDVLTDHHRGLGASRRVEFHDGNSVIETVVEQSEPNAIAMTLPDFGPLKNLVVTIRIVERANERLEVTFSIDYDLRFGPLGWLLHALVMKRAFRKIFGISLDGLRYHLETGNLVADSVPALAAS